MKVTFLGTNGWFSTGLGNTSCVLIEWEKHYVVLDAGDGIHKLDRRVKADKPIVLFLSHLHFDHILGFHVFNKFKFKQAVHIYGLKGTEDSLRIMRHPYTVPFVDLPFPVMVHDIEEGSYESPFPFTCKLLLHADPCLGYRIQLDNRVITYCTDTGVCGNLRDLARDADLLITECSLKPGQTSGKWAHLNPKEAAAIAKQAGAKQLVLTHFDAENYKGVEDRFSAEAAAKKVFKSTIAARDNLEVQL